MRIMYLCFCILMSVLIWLWCSGIACAQDSMSAQTPPMGWNSWNHFACDVSDDAVRAQADALVKTGIKSVGYTYILIEPGVTSWSQIVPDFETTFENIDTFLAAGRRSNTLGMINSVWTDDGQILLPMSLPAIAYGAVAAWQSTPVERANFFPDYAPLPYPANTSMDVALALKHLTQAETELQKALGHATMTALWEDPFYLAHLTGLLQNQEHLRQERLLAEQARSNLDHALASGADPFSLSSLLIESRLLDYVGQKFQTPSELIDLWRRVGAKRPDPDTWWNVWESQALYQDHSRTVDLMDAITELRVLYRAEWLEEYTPYRLGSALGRWDAEYQYWRKFRQRLQLFSDRSHEGDVLPPLEKLAQEH